jgi:hypothetical protein
MMYHRFVVLFVLHCPYAYFVQLLMWLFKKNLRIALILPFPCSYFHASLVSCKLYLVVRSAWKKIISICFVPSVDYHFPLCHYIWSEQLKILPSCANCGISLSKDVIWYLLQIYMKHFSVILCMEAFACILIMPSLNGMSCDLAN